MFSGIYDNIVFPVDLLYMNFNLFLMLSIWITIEFRSESVWLCVCMVCLLLSSLYKEFVVRETLEEALGIKVYIRDKLEDVDICTNIDNYGE